MKKTGTLLLAVVLLLVTAGLAVAYYLSSTSTKALEPQSPVAKEVKAVVRRLYMLEYRVTCRSTHDVATLTEVLVNSPDYQITDVDRQVIRAAYGDSALSNGGVLKADGVLTTAGLLTAKQAYFRALNIEPVEPQPTLLPTAVPIFTCTPDMDDVPEANIAFKSLALARDGSVKVNYYYFGDTDAVLRQFGGRWMITSVVVRHP